MKTGVSKKLMLLFVALFIGFQAKAQGISGGIKAGVNYSSVVGDLTDGVQFRLSGHGGIYAVFDIAYNFKFQPELLYSSQGFQFTTDLLAIDSGSNSNPNRTRTNVRLNYLTLPLIAKFRISDTVQLEFGPQFGFLIDQVTIVKTLDGPNDDSADRRTRLAGNFQLDYGGVVGLGIHLTKDLELYPRFYLGLRDRLNQLPLQQNVNVAIQLGLAYRIIRR